MNNFAQNIEYQLGGIEVGGKYDKYAWAEEINMVHSPKAFTLGKNEKKDNDTVYLGFEWEHPYKVVGFNNYVSKYLKSDLGKYINFRAECNALELVSIPATLEGHKRWMGEYFWPSKVTNRFKSYRGSGNGIHVHVDKKCLTKESMTNLLVFFANKENHTFLSKIAGRDITTNEWCSINTDTELQYRDKKIIGHNIVLDEKNLTEAECFFNEKEIAINSNTAFGTIEIRIFNTVHTKAAFYKKLEFVDAMIRFCKQKQLEDMEIEPFIKFVEANKYKYPNLIKHRQIVDRIRRFKN